MKKFALGLTMALTVSAAVACTPADDQARVEGFDQQRAGFEQEGRQDLGGLGARQRDGIMGEGRARDARLGEGEARGGRLFGAPYGQPGGRAGADQQRGTAGLFGERFERGGMFGQRDEGGLFGGRGVRGPGQEGLFFGPRDQERGGLFGARGGAGQQEGGLFGARGGAGQQEGGLFGARGGAGQRDGGLFGGRGGAGQQEGGLFGARGGAGQRDGGLFGGRGGAGQQEGGLFRGRGQQEHGLFVPRGDRTPRILGGDQVGRGGEFGARRGTGLGVRDHWFGAHGAGDQPRMGRGFGQGGIGEGRGLVREDGGAFKGAGGAGALHGGLGGARNLHHAQLDRGQQRQFDLGDGEFDQNLSEELSEQVEQIDGVRNARVIVFGDHVIVGVDAEGDHDATIESRVKSEIADEVEGKTIHVTTEDDQLDRMGEMTDGARGGRGQAEGFRENVADLLEGLGRTAAEPLRRR